METIPAEGFLDLIERCGDILSKEWVKRGGLIHLAPRGEAIVVGDLHGDLESLSFILEDCGSGSAHRSFVFLGDYGDRGSHSIEVYQTILEMKTRSKENVVLLRGNHEGPMPVWPHDLPYRFRERYGDWGKTLYRAVRQLWNWLPIAALVEGKYLLLHGGIPANMHSLEDLARARGLHPQHDYLEDILWSDPRESSGVSPSPRGAGKYFGPDVTKAALSLVGVKTLIRSHEPCDGVLVHHDGRVLTLFSRKGAPYHNRCAAYLKINLEQEAMSAYDLAGTARLF